MRRELSLGQFNEALAQVEAFNRDHPNSADGLYLLGEVSLRRNAPEQALAAFTRAASFQSPSGEQLRLVGLTYVLLGDNADAAHWLEQAVVLSPEDSEAWYALGRVKYSTGDFHAAELDFLRALRTAPGSVKVQDNLGLAYVAQGKPQEALGAYREAIRLQSNSPVKNQQPWLDYGTLLLQLGNNRASIDALTEAAAIAPSCVDCRETLGRALLQDEQVDKSVQEFLAALALEPANPRIHFELGRAYKKAGNQAGAQAEFQQSARLYGTHSTPTH